MAEVHGRPAAKYTVLSVARALNILELLADPAVEKGLSVTELGESIGLSKSATFAILQTLLHGGYISDTGTGQHRRYRLGRALTRLGDRARTQTPLRELAHPTLRRLADELMLSVRLGILHDAAITAIDRVDAPGGLRIDLRMGDRELFHTTAIGKAILAAHSDAEARELLGRGKLVKRTPRTITSRDDLIDHLALIRDRGYALDDEEDYQGIICVGAAIRDHAGAANAAISVTTLKAGLTDERLSLIGRTLVEGAAEISAALGNQP